MPGKGRPFSKGHQPKTKTWRKQTAQAIAARQPKPKAVAGPGFWVGLSRAELSAAIKVREEQRQASTTVYPTFDDKVGAA